MPILLFRAGIGNPASADFRVTNPPGSVKQTGHLIRLPETPGAFRLALMKSTIRLLWGIALLAGYAQMASAQSGQALSLQGRYHAENSVLPLATVEPNEPVMLNCGN